MRDAKGPVALACVSDVHLWHKSPPCRSGEPDWYAAMGRTLLQVRYVKESANGAGQGVPLAYAGDVFDRWNAPPELISWAIKYLPSGFAVPGQHDLPYHRYDDVKKSAYWTLCEAGVLTNLRPGRPENVGGVVLHGFPWGYPVEPPYGDSGLGQNVAIVHAYVWAEGRSHPEASRAQHFKRLAPALKGYAAAFFGDNHLPFVRHVAEAGCWVVNGGGLMRRRSDELTHTPFVCLLHEGGQVSRVRLDVSEEAFEPTPDRKLPQGDAANFEVFLQSLQTLGHTVHNYRDALMEYMDRRGVMPGVRSVLLKALEANDE